MPQVIAPFVIAVDALLVSAFGASAAIFILDVGVKLAGLALLGAISRKLTELPDLNQTAKSHLLTVRGTIEHQRIIYGESLFSGPLWYMNAAGSHNQSMHHAIIVAGHEIEDITDIWIDEEIVPDASIDWLGDGSVDSGWLAGDTGLATTAYIEKKLGRDNETASSILVAGFTEVTSQHQGRNIAYFVVRNDYFDGQTDVYSKGAPHNYRALVKGKKVYNPNSDGTTAWGTGPHRVDDSSTWEWSDNPALCWADYMIDTRLGFGEAASRINYGYVASAAAINSAVIFTPVGTSHRFSCNGGLSTGNTHEANLAAILSAGNMTMALVQGEWKLRPWAYETPALAFGDDDLRSDIAISLGSEEDRRYNAVRGQFIDKDRLYQAHQFPAFVSSEYYLRDNSETLYSDVQMPMTTDIWAAQRIAAGVLEQSDLQKTVIYPSNFKTLPVEIGGTIMLSNTKMGWVDDTFRVTNYKINDMQGIDLVLQEDNSAAYTDVGTAEYAVSSGGTYITADPGVPAPSSFYIQNIPDAMHLFWTPAPARLYEYTEVWRNKVNSFGNADKIYQTRGDNYIDKPQTQGYFYYWLRSQNVVGEVSSFTFTGTTGVLGKYIQDTALITDPTFDQTSLGLNDNTFWRDIDSYNLGPGFGSGAFSVVSDSGAAATPFLKFTAAQQSFYSVSPNLYNNKWSPIVQGAAKHVQIAYRVPDFVNVRSAYMQLHIAAAKLEDITPDFFPTIAETRLYTFPNSINWAVFSDQIEYSDLTLTGSENMMSAYFTMQVLADTGTSTFEADFDSIYMRNA